MTLGASSASASGGASEPLWNIRELGWRRFFLRTLVLMNYAQVKAVTDQMEEGASERRLAQCLHPSACLRAHANRYAHQVVCDRKKGGCGAVVVYTPTVEARFSDCI